MKKRLRIGVLTHNYPINSKERKDAGIFIYDFCQELSKKSDVFVFCPDFGGKKELYKKTPVTWFGWGGGNEKFGNWKLFNPVYVYKFFKLIFVGQSKAIEFARINNLDYCLACWTLPSAIFGLRIKQKLGIPYASWSLGSDVNKYVKIPILGQLIYLSIKSADALFANSYALAEKVKSISNKKCNFMPAITDFNTKRQVRVDIDANFYNFLFVGRLEKVKGVDILIEAASKLKENTNKFRINILGGGTMLDDLIEQCKDLEITQYIKFVGWASEETVSSYMKKCDCLVISSRNESLPLVAIEAAKSNLPVIATNVGDCHRIVEGYKIGYIAQKENSDDLARVMQKSLEKGNKLRKESSKGLAAITRDYKQEKAVEIFLNKIQK